MSDALQHCSEALRQAGVDKFQCTLTEHQLYEMNLEGSEFSLIRTTTDNALHLLVIIDGRKADISLNSVEPEAIDEAVRSVIELSKTSQPDPDYDISPAQAAQQFAAGPERPDPERMYQLLQGYRQQVQQTFPLIKLSESILAYNHAVSHFINSNGVDFRTNKGLYSLSSVFASKEGEKTSSFNYTGFVLAELERDLLDCASLRTLLQQSVEHLEARPLTGKFVGDVVITPDCLNDFIAFYAMAYLSDRALITGTSLLQDKLGQVVADRQLTLAAKPVAPEIVDGYFVTNDGFAAEDVTFIEQGVLKSFLLSLYGANKTKRERAKNGGGCWVVEAGQQTVDELIRGVERGVLVARFSGGNPSQNGDFSGVAKNSYYIENGEIKYPVSETMIAGNLLELFQSIKGISAERINFGFSILPYLRAGGVTISGK